MKYFVLIFFLYNNSCVYGKLLQIQIPKPCLGNYFVDLYPFQNKSQAAVLTIRDLDKITKNESEDITNCYIRQFQLQSLFIVDNWNFDGHALSKLKTFLASDPTIVIFTTFPTVAILDRNEQILKIMLYKKWPLVLVIATTNESHNICNTKLNNTERLFELELFTNELWQRYQSINLIIHFPVICADVYFVYGGKKNVKNNTMYGRSIEMISKQTNAEKFILKKNNKEITKNYLLRADIFHRFPTAITDCEGIKHYLTFKGHLSYNFCGIDGLVMADIVEYFGFNLPLRINNATLSYGYLDQYGRVTGSLGKVVRGEMDISFNSRFVTTYRTPGVCFMNYIFFDCICAIVKISDEVPLWLFPYDVYSIEMWSILLSALFIAGVCLWLTVKYSKSKENKNRFKVQGYILDSMLTGLFGLSLIRSRSIILKSVCFFSAIIFTSIFQGHVNYAYTTLVRYHQINDLQELYDSDIKIMTSPGIANLIQPPYNDLHKALFKRVMVLKGNKSYTEILIKDKNAVLGRRSDSLIETMKFYKDKKGQPLFHVADESFKCFFLSYIANRGFPFIDEVNVLVERLTAVGLPGQYYKWTKQALQTTDVKQSIPRPTSPTLLSDLRIPFGLLATGYIISVIVFIFEKFPIRIVARDEALYM